jgi:RNA polymerase sigma factor (sigma-70 family)
MEESPRLADDAYEAWAQATAEEKEARLDDLYRAVRDYADRFLGKFEGEYVPDLGKDIASDVLTQLDKFRRESKFSTWVGAIIKNHWRDHLEETVANRERFVEPRAVEYADGENSGALVDRETGDPEAVSEGQDRLDTCVLISELEQRIPERDKPLFEGIVKEGKTQLEVAQDLGLDPDALESRYRRLRTRLRDDIEKK